MRSACAIGVVLAFLFASVLARAQQTPSPAKLAPATPAVNKTTCEKPVAKIGTPAPTVTTADLFAALDVNKDGKIDPTEFKGPKKAFAWVDTDHDGTITRPEATRAYLTIAAEWRSTSGSTRSRTWMKTRTAKSACPSTEARPAPSPGST